MYFNEQFELSAVEMHRLGVFNPQMGQDSELFVDPKLLEASNDEFAGAREKLDEYFADTVYLLRNSDKQGDIWWIQARDRIVSKERASAGLGYSKTGKSGSGIGRRLAGQIVDRAAEILPHVEFKPDVFELIGIFARGVGCDRLSDLLVNVLANKVHAYTARVARELGIHQLATLNVAGTDYAIPCFSHQQGPILLMPRRLLRALPIAADIGEALESADLNQEIRHQLNAVVAAASKKHRSPTKRELQEFISARPGIYKTIVSGYENATSEPYDFERDVRAVGDHKALAKEIVGRQNPVDVDCDPATRVERLLADVVGTLRKLVEENRLSDLLFNDDGTPRKEVMSQRLIFAVAEIYSRLYDVDLNREPNAGNGAVDFKFSVGREARILIEVKLSTHQRIREAFYYQLPAYAKSEGVSRLVLLILQVDESESQLKTLRSAIAADPKNTIQLETVDARRKPSASKRAA